VKPWDRLPGESDAAFAAFGVFLRSVKAVVKSREFSDLVKEKTGIDLSPSYLANLQTDNKWRERKRAYQSSLLNKGMKGVAWNLAKDAVPLAKGNRKVRLLVQKATIEAAERIRLFTDDAESRQFNGFLDALDKILNLGLKTDLDNADQLRRISAEIRKFGGTDPGGDESEELPEISVGTGEIQPGSPAEAGLLGEADRDMPSRGESSDPDGSGSIG